MADQKILSIVVPTIERYDTLIPLINSLMEWESMEFELIVHDNSNNNELIIPVLENYKNDNRLKYFYVPERLSAIENCDLAVSKATGTFVSFIGDDDGLIPQIINTCKWMIKENIDSMYCKIGFYTWPGTGHAVNINNGYNGKLLLEKFNGVVTNINPKRELERVFESGAQSLYNVPRLYQGVLSKKVLDKLFSAVGTYFPGPVPDMSNAVACNQFVNKHVFIDLPLIISGHSKKSMSGKNSLRQHQGEIKKEKSLPENSEEIWSSEIPFFWSAPTIWAEAAIQASNNIGNSSLIKKFNYSKLYAHCFAYCDSIYYSRIIKAAFYNRNLLQKISIVLKGIYYYTSITLKRIQNLLMKFAKGINGMECVNIYEANKLTEQSVNLKEIAKFNS